jgi:terpene synthase-like protein
VTTLSFQTIGAGLLSSYPDARRLAVSKSHRRRMKKSEEAEFALLFHRFEAEYGDASARLAEQLRESYPEITKQGRRTGRALRNICFFVWCCGRNGDRNLIPTLFRAAVLLSAQDDYYDNARIPAAQKESFCAATNHALRTNSVQRAFERSLQLRELISLWSEVAGTIPRSAPQVRSYWIEKACQLNDAMAAENRAVRRATITYERYMSTAIYSIGIVFLWATYLAHKHVPVITLREMDPVLLQGARIVRLSNDLASYRQHRNKANAVTLVGGSSPGMRIRQLVLQESRAFRRCVEALEVGPDVRGVLLRSMDFLREFYQRSDFDRRPAL